MPSHFEFVGWEHIKQKGYKLYTVNKLFKKIQVTMVVWSNDRSILYRFLNNHNLCYFYSFFVLLQYTPVHVINFFSFVQIWYYVPHLWNLVLWRSLIAFCHRAEHTLNLPIFILSVTKKYLATSYIVLFELENFPFLPNLLLHKYDNFATRLWKSCTLSCVSFFNSGFC